MRIPDWAKLIFKKEHHHATLCTTAFLFLLISSFLFISKLWVGNADPVSSGAR